MCEGRPSDRDFRPPLIARYRLRGRAAFRRISQLQKLFLHWDGSIDGSSVQTKGNKCRWLRRGIPYLGFLANTGDVCLEFDGSTRH